MEGGYGSERSKKQVSYIAKIRTLDTRNRNCAIKSKACGTVVGAHYCNFRDVRSSLITNYKKKFALQHHKILKKGVIFCKKMF